jgi:Lon protease-like protein
MAFELPLFPLDVVLFPGMLLPLHIFEARYRLMMARCLEGDHTFGVSLISTGAAGAAATIGAGVGCVAEIVESVTLDDGRLNLQTVGKRRFQVLSMRVEDEYLMGTVEWLDDVATESEAAPLANQVLRSLRRYLGAIGTNIGESRGALGVPDNAHDLSMWIAAILAVPNRQKQELLELRSTAMRLEHEGMLLLRAEVIHKAWSLRQTWQEPKELEDPALPAGYSEFFSLN